MLKRGLSLILAGTLAMTMLFTGCTKKDETTDTKPETKQEEKSDSTTAKTEETGTDNTYEGTVTVQMIGSFEMETTTDPVTGKKRQGLNVVKEEFEKRYPGATLEFVIMGWDSYTQKTQTMLSVNECDVYQVPGIALFADQGYLEPLAPYIEKDNFDLNQLIDGQLDGWMAMGPDETELNIYGLPVMGDTRVIMYDKEIFDQWGVEYLSERPTLEEIKEKAAKMTGKNPVTGEQNYGIAWRGRDSADTLVNVAEHLGGQWGEGFRFKEMTFNFNSEEFIKAGTELKGLLEYAPEGVVTGQGLELFGTAKNNVAINLRVGPNNYIDTTVDPTIADKYSVSYLFVNEEKGMGGMFAGSPFAIGSTSDNKDLAWEYLKFMTSDFYQQWQYESFSTLPTVKSALTWDTFDSPEKQLILNSMSELWTPRYPYRAGQPRGILTDSVEQFMLGDKTVEEGLTNAQTQSEEWIKTLK